MLCNSFILQSCLHWHFVMYSITYFSVVLRWLVGDFSSLCSTEMDLSITRLFVSKKSKHTLIFPHGIGYSVWSSLTPSLLQLTELFLLILITGQYFLSSLHEFTSFGAVFHNKNYQWFTNKIALSSKYAFSATFKLKWHF